MLSVVSDSEVMVTFVTLHGEKTKTNISERHKIIKSWRRLENKSKGRNKKWELIFTIILQKKI